MCKSGKFVGIIFLVMLFSQTAVAKVRHLRVELMSGISLIGSGYLKDDAAKYGLSDASVEQGSFSGDVFAGTDIANGITIGVQIGAVSGGKFMGRKTDSIFIEQLGRTVATHWSLFPMSGGPQTFLGIVRFGLLSNKHSSLNLALGLGRANFWFEHMSNRYVTNTPVYFYSYHYYKDVNKNVLMLGADARYQPKSWIALFLRLGYLSIPQVEFPEEKALETITSPSGIEYRELSIPSQSIEASHMFLKLGLEISPF